MWGGVYAGLVAKRWKIGSICLAECALRMRSPSRKSYLARVCPPETRTRVHTCHIRRPSFSLSGGSVGKSAAKPTLLRGAIDEIGAEDFQKVIDVNVTGTWYGCKAVTPFMKKQEYGRIVNISSIFGVVGFADRTPYTASKGAVLNMTRALAIELAPWKITVNAMLPGPFATEINLPLLDDPEKYKAFMSNVPLGRWGDLSEIGGLALFLASDASSYCTGGAYPVDGGWTAK